MILHATLDLANGFMAYRALQSRSTEPQAPSPEPLT